MLKSGLLPNIFVEMVINYIFHESSKEQHLFEIEIFSNIINVFAVAFDQFNASLMNKSINFFCTPNFWAVVCVCEETADWMNEHTHIQMCQ